MRHRSSNSCASGNASVPDAGRGSSLRRAEASSSRVRSNQSTSALIGSGRMRRRTRRNWRLRRARRYWEEVEVRHPEYTRRRSTCLPRCSRPPLFVPLCRSSPSRHGLFHFPYETSHELPRHYMCLVALVGSSVSPPSLSYLCVVGSPQDASFLDTTRVWLSWWVRPFPHPPHPPPSL